MFSKEEQALAWQVIEPIKKISRWKWEWKPEVGEWYIILKKREEICCNCPSCRAKNKVKCIGNIHDLAIAEVNLDHCECCIPLLHWERIEEILKNKLGYWFDIDELNFGYRVGICNTSNELLAEQEGKTRQEAVMRAVIELAKEE